MMHFRCCFIHFDFKSACYHYSCQFLFTAATTMVELGLLFMNVVSVIYTRIYCFHIHMFFFFFLLFFSRLSWCCLLCFLQLFSFQTLNLVFGYRNSQQAVIALQIDTSSWRFISPFLLFSKILCQGLFCRFRRRMCTTTTSLSVPFLPFTSKTCEAR